MSLTPSGVEASRIRQRAVPDERRRCERDRLLHHGRRRGQDPGDLQEPLGFLKPRRRLLFVELAKVLHGRGQQRIPSGARARRPLVQHLLLLFSPERPEVPGQVVQDRPCEVSIGPPGAYRVGVVAECDPGWLARASCRIHRRLVRSQRFQPTVQLRRRSMCGERTPRLRVWGCVRESERTGEPGERWLRTETRHDHVAAHTSQSDVTALRKKRGFRTERSGRSATHLISVVYRTTAAAVYSFVHNSRLD